MAEPVDPIDPVLRTLCPRVCVNCDYCLDGLPAGVVCPECGMTSPAGLVTLSGWRYPPLIAWGAWLWFAEGAFIFYLLWAFIAICIELRQDPDHSWIFATIIFSGIGIAAWLNVRLLAMRPPMRLRVSQRGYELRRGLGPLQLRPWRAAYPAKLRELGKGHWQISIGWKDPIRSGSNALQLCWCCDAASAEQLRQMVDGFTQPLKVEQQFAYSHML